MQCPYLHKQTDPDLGHTKYLCVKVRMGSSEEPYPILASREPWACLHFLGVCPWHGTVIACEEISCPSC